LTAFLDAYALIALAAEEAAAAEVETLLRDDECLVAVVNLAECVDVLSRIHGLTENEIRRVIEPLILGGAVSTVVSQDRDAWTAASLRSRHYERKMRPLSLADCFLLAHALDRECSIATCDRPLVAAARAEGVTVLALPDSAGAHP
jgi:uncharacterized protein with PIN domain